MAGHDTRRAEAEVVGRKWRGIIVLQSVCEARHLVMAGVMDELRLDFGSRDVLFVSMPSWDPKLW